MKCPLSRDVARREGRSIRYMAQVAVQKLLHHEKARADGADGKSLPRS